MFFGSWYDLLRIIITGVFAYAGLILLLRVTGKRSLSKMNMFDLIVTVALGSVLASTILSSQTSIVEGLTAFALLILVQYAITWTSTRSKTVRRLIKAQPKLLYYQGEVLEDEMRSERVPMEELYYALRQAGFASFDNVRAVILETNGQLSVLPTVEAEKQHVDALKGVEPSKLTAEPRYPVP